MNLDRLELSKEIYILQYAEKLAGEFNGDIFAALGYLFQKYESENNIKMLETVLIIRNEYRLYSQDNRVVNYV